MNTIPTKYIIIDQKKPNDYNKITISEYLKKNVVDTLEKSINLNKLEDACIWAVELHASGQFDKIWDKLILIMSKDINTSNPHLPEYFYKIYQKYKKVYESFKKQYIIETRNNQEIRNAIMDIITILTLSKKNNTLNNSVFPRVGKSDMNPIQIKKNIKTSDMYLINNFINGNEPSEICIALNEISYHIRNWNPVVNIFFWIKWLLFIEKEKGKNNIAFVCDEIDISDVEKKYHTDWVWILWKILLNESKFRKSSNLTNQIISLYKIFKINYKKSTKDRKMFIIYNAVLYYNTQINWSIPVIHPDQYHLKIKTCCNNNYLYKKIKKLLEVNNPKIIKYDNDYIKVKKKKKSAENDKPPNSNKKLELDERMQYLFSNFKKQPEKNILYGKTNYMSAVFSKEDQIKTIIY